MRNNLIKKLIILSLFFTSSTTLADSEIFPAMRYISDLEDSDMYELLKSDRSMAKLDKELLGSPFLLVSWVENSSTDGGQAAAAFTGILAGSTLGLIPMVSNSDLKVQYRIRLNKTTIAEFVYTKNFTDTHSMWAMNNELAKPAKEWVRSTVKKFLVDVKKDEKFRQAIDEYNYYFSES